MIGLEYIKTFLAYDPVTGKFTWIRNYGKKVAGDEAGNIDRRTGMRGITIRGVKLSAPYMAWLMHYEEIPDKALRLKIGRDYNAIENIYKINLENSAKKTMQRLLEMKEPKKIRKKTDKPIHEKTRMEIIEEVSRYVDPCDLTKLEMILDNETISDRIAQTTVINDWISMIKECHA